jgi:Putative rhamnosyl transferase
MPTTHVLLTRFNLNYGSVYDVRYSEDWMRHRMGIFERVCLPSVARQTAREFRWLIFFDRDRSRDWRGEIDRLAALGRFTPVFLDGAGGLVAEIGRHAPTGGVLLTSRLDNDDVLHPQYVADLRRRADACLDEGVEAPFVVDVEHGCWWDLGRDEIRQFRHKEISPYASLLERVGAGAPRTVFACPHNRLDVEFGSAHLIGGYRVLTLLHDRNVLNGIRRNGWAARTWLRIRDGHRYLAGESARRLLADFGVLEPAAGDAEQARGGGPAR